MNSLSKINLLYVSAVRYTIEPQSMSPIWYRRRESNPHGQTIVF